MLSVDSASLLSGWLPLLAWFLAAASLLSALCLCLSLSLPRSMEEVRTATVRVNSPLKA
eukprot:SAG25_NODE_1564_length_2761_cov_1.827573_3_plen_59_part_00